jgi:hypothetical protein
MEENPYRSPRESGYRPPAQPWLALPRIKWRKLFFAAAGTSVVCVGLVFLGGMAISLIDAIGWTFDDNTGTKLAWFFLLVEIVCVLSFLLAVIAALGSLFSWLFQLVRCLDQSNTRG